MEETLGIIAYIITYLLVWGAMFMMMVRKNFDVPFTFLALNCYLLCFPLAFHLIGVHSPVIDIHIYENLTNIYILQIFIITIYYLFVVMGYFAAQNPYFIKSLFPDYNYQKSDMLCLLGITVIFVFSVALLSVPFSMSGGDLLEMAKTVRHERFFAGFTYLVQIPVVGLFIMVWYLLDLMRRKRDREYHPQGAIAYVLFLFITSLLLGLTMGGKGIVIFPLVAFAVGYIISVRKMPIRALILPVLILIMLTISLQFARVFYVQEGEAQTQQVLYTGLGLSLIDGNLVYISTLGEEHHTDTGEDFYYGLASLIPRSIWEEKPNVVPGGRFRRQIEHRPDSGGWPVFGFNVWYGNFSFLGVLCCGLLTGMLLRGLQEQYKNLEQNPHAIVFSMMIIIKIFMFGISSLFITEYILWVVPLFIFKWLTSRKLLPASV